MKLKPRSSFELTARRRLASGTPHEAIFTMINEFEGVTENDVDNFLKMNSVKQAINGALSQSKDQKEMIYNTLDKKFIEKHSLLVSFTRGENVSFYEYRNGVYISLTDVDMINLVDALMEELMLLDYRTKRRYITDTIGRIGSLLSRTQGRYFTDETFINSKWYINLKNGLLETDTYTLLPHTPKYFSVSQIPFNYDPEQKCQEFLKFIDKITNGRSDIAQMIQEMYGYLLSDGNRRHKVFYLYGDTARNGKSTCAKIACGLIGSSNVSSLSLEQIAKESSAMMTTIVGKQINFTDELSTKFIESSKLTAMSSESLIEINPKYKSPFMYKVKAKFIVCCNDLPRFSDNQGMKHRMLTIPFNVHIKEEQRILDYDQILLNTEGAGILNWAIEGAKLLKKNGVFFVSKDSKDDMNENAMGSNSVYAFLESEYKFSPLFDTLVSPNDMYGDVGIKGEPGTMYRLYCHREGIGAVSKKKFEKEVMRFANETQKITQKRDKFYRRCYIGLQDKDHEEKTGESLLINTKLNEEF